jgi:phosphoribosylaminoimidazole-succinocarboxamide synthase
MDGIFDKIVDAKKIKIIEANLNNCLLGTNFVGIGEKKEGKVRDIYFSGDSVVLISTDRLSAFDRVLAVIPFKGQVLSQTSAWWMEHTKQIIPNFVTRMPDPNVTIGKRCQVFPFEVIVRGYLTGSTSTSSWVNYQKGERNLCGNILPEGMKKNQKFSQPIITPSTKLEEHDRNITGEEIIAERMATPIEWGYIRQKAFELFKFGQETAKKNGLILVDTKYEFGKDEKGSIVLIDELHTPDSSRYWLANTYEEKMKEGKEPDNIDKEFIRLWFRDHCDPYKDLSLPKAPANLVIELSRRYIMLYERITGQKFVLPDSSQPILKRIENNLKTLFPDLYINYAK